MIEIPVEAARPFSILLFRPSGEPISATDEEIQKIHEVADLYRRLKDKLLLLGWDAEAFNSVQAIGKLAMVADQTLSVLGR